MTTDEAVIASIMARSTAASGTAVFVDAVVLRQLLAPLLADLAAARAEVARLRERPMQPVKLDKDGVARFHENAIVRYLLDHGGIDLNQLAYLDFTDDDRMQFAQLIGYSVCGYGELSYVSDESFAEAESRAKAALDTPAREGGEGR